MSPNINIIIIEIERPTNRPTERIPKRDANEKETIKHSFQNRFVCSIVDIVFIMKLIHLIVYFMRRG